jgi:propionyl-CoA synthetase
VDFCGARGEDAAGEVLRGTMRKMADGEPFQIPATIDEPSVLDDIRKALRSLGYARESLLACRPP